MDVAILRQCDTIVFKEPTLMQASKDRPEVRDMAARALKYFESIPKEERLRAAYIADSDFNGMISYDLPDFWREDAGGRGVGRAWAEWGHAVVQREGHRRGTARQGWRQGRGRATDEGAGNDGKGV